MGLARAALEAAIDMRGQLVYVNGRERVRIELTLPPEVPYGFAALPQYETERLLEEYVIGLGTTIERGTELLSFTQDEDGVTAVLRTAAGAEEEARVGYLIGCDGAHSTVRKQLGLTFEGGAFPEEYMLADVEADWDLPYGYGVRSSHVADDGSTDDLLVCIPLPGTGRYRMSMLVPPGLSTAATVPDGTGSSDGTGGTARGDGVAHGLEAGRAPELPHIQAVVDRLGPMPATLSRMRWSSVFRISHRIVDRYGEGRVFVAGDAAHIHPPTGAQGMNTGIQDAGNLAWKLALACRGEAGPDLLASYDAERRPVGEEVVGRTVRHATQGTDADPDDPRTVMLREAQLLVSYRGGPLARSTYGQARAPRPGDRAPDCAGLTTAVAAYLLRLLDILRGRTEHVLLLYAAEPAQLAAAAVASGVVRWPDGGPQAEHRPQTLAVLAREAPRTGLDGLAAVPGYHDAAGEFARLYDPDGPTGFVVRPDGHLGARFPLAVAAAALRDYVASLSMPAASPRA